MHTQRVSQVQIAMRENANVDFVVSTGRSASTNKSSRSSFHRDDDGRVVGVGEDVSA